MHISRHFTDFEIKFFVELKELVDERIRFKLVHFKTQVDSQVYDRLYLHSYDQMKELYNEEC